jgi:anti-anti-sigma regulatory factor
LEQVYGDRRRDNDPDVPAGLPAGAVLQTLVARHRRRHQERAVALAESSPIGTGYASVGVTFLRSAGDLAGVAALGARLSAGIARDDENVVPDLSELESIGSSIAGVISRAGQLLGARSRSLILRSRSPNVWHVLDACGARTGWRR